MKDTIRGLLEHLLTALIVLKLVGWLKWSWWLVFSPMWAPLSLAVACYAYVGVLMLLRWRRTR